MRVICNEAKTCGNKKCPGAKAHGAAEFLESGVLCVDVLHRCSVVDRFVSCVPVSGKRTLDPMVDVILKQIGKRTARYSKHVPLAEYLATLPKAERAAIQKAYDAEKKRLKKWEEK